MAMTIKSIVDTLLEARDLHRVQGGDDNASPILPWIIMDVAYTLYKQYIDTDKYKFTLNKLRKEWIKEFSAFNEKGCTNLLDLEQGEFLGDMMEEFEKYIKNDLTIAFYQVTNVIENDFSFEEEKELAAAVCIFVLTQCADAVYRMVFTPVNRKDIEIADKHLLNCKRIMHLWQKEYRKRKGYRTDVDLYANKTIAEAIDIFVRKQVRFLKKYDKEWKD